MNPAEQLDLELGYISEKLKMKLSA